MRKQKLGPVDRLGIIKAKLAALESLERAAQAEVLALGIGQHCGDLYDATVYEGAKVTLSTDAVREKLGDLWVVRHSSRTPYTAVKVTARKTRRLRSAA